MHQQSVTGYGSEHLHKDCRNNVGKIPFSAGADSNLRRLRGRAMSKAEQRIWDLHMGPYELRRRGNALRGDPGDHSWRGNTSKGQRGPRRLVGEVNERGEGHRSHRTVARSDAESRTKPAAQGVHACQRLSFGATGKGPRGTVTKVANRTREIRLSGMKTGACGNVTMGAGLRPATKVAEPPPDPTVHAPQFYPHISLSGSGEGPGGVIPRGYSTTLPLSSTPAGDQAPADGREKWVGTPLLIGRNAGLLMDCYGGI